MSAQKVSTKIKICRYSIYAISNIGESLIKGDKILQDITSLQDKMLKSLHEVHIGIEITRKFARYFINLQGLNTLSELRNKLSQ